MEQYTIYCTAEQTEKALKLGAPIKINHWPPINGENFMWLSPPEDAIVWDNSTNCLIPTMGQMLGWLEEQESIQEIYVSKNPYAWFYSVFNDCGEDISLNDESFSTRKEATLAAIDAALDYLSNKKK